MPGMGKRLTTGLALFVLFVVPLGAYTGGYFCLGERRDWFSGAGPAARMMGIERVYSQQWMTTAFRPAAKLEGWLRGVEVEPTWFMDSILRDSTTPFS